jgi:hypothetical protein
MNNARSFRLLVRLIVAGTLAISSFIAQGFSVVAPTFDELVDEAADIVRGKVVSVESYRTTSANGTPVIKTRVTWQIASSLKGASDETLTLEFLGGRVGAESLSVSGMPEFKVGEDDFLFVEPNRRVICPLIAAGHGRYEVRMNEATGKPAVYRNNGRPLTTTADVARPLDQVQSTAQPPAALTPEDFATEIRSTLNRLHGQSSAR